MHLRKATYCLLSLLIWSVTYIPASAQKTVWDTPKDNSKKALKKVDKGKKKMAQWKNHAKDWGLKESYDHQLSLGAQLNSNGWTGSVYYMKRTAARKKNVYTLSFSEIKHEKEIKQEGSTAYPELGLPTPYFFGKINNLYTLQLGFGRETLLLPKVIDGNISVSARWTAGFSLAMLKPYYLRLVYEEYVTADPIVTVEEQRYSEAQDAFLRSGNKLGTAKWAKGLDEMSYHPGAFVSGSVVIEPTADAWFVQTITLGGSFAYHSKQLPILALVKAYPWQANLYVGLALGKRW